LIVAAFRISTMVMMKKATLRPWNNRKEAVLNSPDMYTRKWLSTLPAWVSYSFDKVSTVLFPIQILISISWSCSVNDVAVSSVARSSSISDAGLNLTRRTVWLL
jgi:hypothetical protein